MNLSGISGVKPISFVSTGSQQKSSIAPFMQGLVTKSFGLGLLQKHTPKKMLLLLPAVWLSLAAFAAAQANPPTGKWFDHYIVVVLENLDYKDAVQNEVFKKVASSGILQTNYHGVTHPSQPNCK